MKVATHRQSPQQLPLEPGGVQGVYAREERKVRELAYKAIIDNGHTIEFIARLAGILYPEQLSRALNGKGTHVPTAVYAVLLDPTIDEKRIFISGLAAMSKGEFQARPEIPDAEFRRRVESHARQDEAAAVHLRRALGEDRS